MSAQDRRIRSPSLTSGSGAGVAAGSTVDARLRIDEFALAFLRPWFVVLFLVRQDGFRQRRFHIRNRLRFGGRRAGRNHQHGSP